MPEKCSACGQPKFEITKKFKAFLKQYVPRIEEDFPDEFKAIYRMRSDLAHGLDLLTADLEYWNYFGTPLQQWQDDFQAEHAFRCGHSAPELGSGNMTEPCQGGNLAD